MNLSYELAKKSSDQFKSEYRGVLATHVPMALYALESLGANSQQMESYYKHATRILEPKNSAATDVTISLDNWTEYLGKNRHHEEYLIFFRQHVSDFGVSKTLETFVPKLFEGVGGGAFHGLIRLGYAIDAANDNEIIEALGYWSVSYMEIGAKNIEFGSGAVSPVCVLEQLHEKFAGFMPKGSNISTRMAVVGQMEEFQNIVKNVDSSVLKPTDLADLILALFAQTRHFTALHAVTSNHAFRLVAGKVSLPLQAYLSYFASVAAAYLTVGSPKIIDEPNKNLVNFDQKALAEIATASQDDHIPKIVYTCFEECEFYQNKLYLQAALNYCSHE